MNQLFPDDAPRPSATVYGEDLRVGQEYHLGSYTLSEDDLIEFASAWDPQVFHVDKDAAETAQYGGLIASGVQTIAIYQRLVVRDVFDRWSVIAGRSLREVRFLRPARPDDRLTGSVVGDAYIRARPTPAP